MTSITRAAPPGVARSGFEGLPPATRVRLLEPGRPGGLEILWLGRVEYAGGLEIQKSSWSLRDQDRVPDRLLLLWHPPVYTRGSRAGAADVTGRYPSIPVFEVDRGGATTYHGPGQLVGYPVIKLAEGRRDLHRYVRDLEAVLIGTLGSLGLVAGTHPAGTGVWIADRKIASIGVRVARWVTRHGFALNVDPDLDHFFGIIPCGLDRVRMTSIRAELGQAPDLEAVAVEVGRRFSDVFGREV